MQVIIARCRLGQERVLHTKDYTDTACITCTVLFASHFFFPKPSIVRVFGAIYHRQCIITNEEGIYKITEMGGKSDEW